MRNDASNGSADLNARQSWLCLTLTTVHLSTCQTRMVVRTVPGIPFQPNPPPRFSPKFHLGIHICTVFDAATVQLHTYFPNSSFNSYKSLNFAVVVWAAILWCKCIHVWQCWLHPKSREIARDLRRINMAAPFWQFEFLKLITFASSGQVPGTVFFLFMVERKRSNFGHRLVVLGYFSWTTYSLTLCSLFCFVFVSVSRALTLALSVSLKPHH